MDSEQVTQDPLAAILAKKKYREDKQREEIAKRAAALKPIAELVQKIADQGGVFMYPGSAGYGPREGPPSTRIPWGDTKILEVHLGDGWHIDIVPIEDEDNQMWYYAWKRGGRYGDLDYANNRLTLSQMQERILTLLSEWVKPNG